MDAYFAETPPNIYETVLPWTPRRVRSLRLPCVAGDVNTLDTHIHMIILVSSMWKQAGGKELEQRQSVPSVLHAYDNL